jgi:hypothetical protein
MTTIYQEIAFSVVLAVCTVMGFKLAVTVLGFMTLDGTY